MNAITIGFRHDGKSEVIANVDVAPHVQVNRFREMTASGNRTHPTYKRVEIHTLANAERFINFDAPHPESKPLTATPELKGKTK
jgi:hypothetical protein